MESVLTQEFIGSNVLIDSRDCFIISGVDGFKILAYKDTYGGGGGEYLVAIWNLLAKCLTTLLCQCFLSQRLLLGVVR